MEVLRFSIQFVTRIKCRSRAAQLARSSQTLCSIEGNRNGRGCYLEGWARRGGCKMERQRLGGRMASPEMGRRRPRRLSHRERQNQTSREDLAGGREILRSRFQSTILKKIS